MNGKVCLVTGATSGIGKQTALALAHMGATVIIVGRDQRKLDATQAELQTSSGNRAIVGLHADLSSQASIRQLAQTITASYPQLDVLVNNAGSVNITRQITIDGIELTFALNHLAYFLLTQLLLELLKTSAPARIVNVSSVAHTIGHIDFNDLQGATHYNGVRAYDQSKLANLLFTYELARRLAGTGVTVNALNPGFVASGFGMNDSGWLRWLLLLGSPFAKTPQQGAETSVYLASAPELADVTGTYFSNCRAARSTRESHDPAVAARLWDVSTQLTHHP